MALQEAKPQGPSDAGPTVQEPRDRPRECGLCGAGGIAARFQGVRSSGARGSQDAPPLRPLLLGLLLLAALPGYCRADSGTDNLQIHVTPTSESFPLGKLLPISPTWPFLEVKSSLAVDGTKNVLGQPPDNTSMSQLSQTPLPKAHHRTRARVDFSSSLYQGSGHSASLDLAKDSTETVVHTRPGGGREATAMSVESSVSPKGELTATAAAAATTTLFLRKSTPAALSAALTAKGAGSSSSLVKSSLTTALAKNVTNKAAPSPKVTAGTVHTAFPFTPNYMLARTAHGMSAHTATQGTTGSASGLLSTTHLPKKPQAMHTGLPNSTRPDTSRASTTRPLTITAALTSITASVKATRLPSLQTGNTDAAFPAVSTAVVTTGRMASNLDCQMSHRLLIKTVLFLTQRRVQNSESLKLGVTKGLTQALRKAFRQNDVSAHVDILEYSHNVTVGYYATKGRLVYLPAVVMDVLDGYGISNATADLKQHTPTLQSVAVLASPWKPQPAGAFRLKTVLQFVSQSDNIQSCKFAQTMEQRLQKAFQDAERKVLNSRSNLTLQIVSTSNASQAVTLVYAVSNQSSFLNGTVASSLLSQLSAELVGFYLTYPPLTIAEPLEYPNLDISETTRDYWVITVLQGVDNSLVGLHNQSFARVMEQRLAQLFMMSQQQIRRFKRATTLGSYTVQMVKMQRVPGPKDPAELTYYTLYNGKPLLGTAAAKILSTIDSQRMALTLHHVVLLQADPVVKNPPNNLWIIAAVLAPIAVVTVIIIIITAVLCRKNKNDFKPDTMINLPQRAKPVQGFDYAKQHLGQQGADEEVIPVTQETVVLPIPVRDTPQERETAQDGSTIKTAKSTETRKRSPSENGSIISNESGKPSSGRRSPQNGMTQQKVTKEETRKRNVTASDEEEGAGLFDSAGKAAAADPFDTSSGSVQLIAIKPSALPVVHPASDRGQESSAALNGEVNKALKQKSDIEHYRNKLRLKAKRKGYYDFPPVETSKGLTERKMYEKAPKEMEHVLDPDPEACAPFAESKNRQQMKNSVYRSRQSLNSPSPGETEMDLLVTRERPRRGIRNSGYDTEPEIIEETNVDRVHEPRGYGRARQVKGHSETSTLSSQPSIDEVRQQMHMLLEEAFSLASAGHAGQSRHPEAYGSTQHLPYSEVVTSAPGTMTRPRAGVQWVPTYRPEMYQYSLPRPAYRFSQLPEMVMGSPPPPVPPRTGPVAVASLRRSTSDIGSKTRMGESTGPEPAQLHDSASFAQVSRGPVSVTQLDQSALNYSGNTVPAVFAIPAANRPGFTGYFIPTPPSSYRSQAWMSYAGENELPSQWADSVPLPGYIEAYPRSRYPQSSPSRLPRQYSQPSNLHPSLEQAPVPSTAASQQSLTENEPPDTPLTNISTAALVKAIREEVAKLAKKQTDMFEFQV
uniref:RIKEN cDNA D430041D05 gene n=1 Tax=Cricetulus griseus TaxID=10029 RepID=A0A8C2MEG9_CRIGR